MRVKERDRERRYKMPLGASECFHRKSKGDPRWFLSVGVHMAEQTKTGNLAEKRRRYRERYPEKIKERRRKYLDNKFRNNPELMKKLKGQLQSDFCRLTRLLFDDVLPRVCAECGTTEDLEIYHKRFSYPIMREDLRRMCRRCRLEERQKIKEVDKL